MKRLLPVAIIAGALLLSYFPLVSGDGVVITDDRFTSDITNGEWPGRVAAGRLVREGHAPVWTRELMGGVALVPAGVSTDPISLLYFAALPPVAAINLFLLTLMLIAGTGTMTLARALGASLAGAALAGIGFVLSGYVVTQLKHTEIIAVISWIPWGTWALLKAFETPHTELPVRPLGWFALFYGLQYLAGFPQSAHIATLWYSPWGLWLIWRSRAGAPLASSLKRVAAFAAAGLLGVCIGAVQLFSMFEFTQLSDRHTGVTLEWVTRTNYWLPNLWTFIVPYKNGDFGDGTYVGRGIFWEDYSYTGLITLAFAALALCWARQKWVLFFWSGAVMALLVVLGHHTPVFGFMFNFVPGMKFFRFPTRFLVLVHFALCVLAGLGLTHVERWLGRRWADGTHQKLLLALSWLVVSLSFADLQYFQLRQNPIADADRWIEPPPTVGFLHEKLGDHRIFTMFAAQAHINGSAAAKGWLDLEPFYALRDLLQPNSNILWNITSVDGYVGLLTREQATLWGGSQIPSQVHLLEYATGQNPKLLTELVQVLRTFSVKYVLSPIPQALGSGSHLGNAYVYELEAPAPRFHLAKRSLAARTNEDAFSMMRSPGFEPGNDVIMMEQEAPPAPLNLPADAGVVLQREDGVSSELTVTSPNDVVLVNTESFFKNWVAEIDGQRVEILRANINQRAVKVPAGTHQVRFFWDSPVLRRGFTVTCIAVIIAIICSVWRRRAPREAAPAAA